ncbi:DAN domain family member 5 [Suncus etruscus]|uniref:DAN domain family member 5 n=1 Tax=Suncus etruscus TaxID=109475 RepID=UPI0021104FB3|nr:DAN domain family member 5 [Suncus etruscus]
MQIQKAARSWEAFLGLQKEASPAQPLPLSPMEVLQEHCRAVPFTQVLSRPGCAPVRVRNRLCFGRCSSLYVPGSGPASRTICNRCGPALQRRVPLVMWCETGRPGSRRPVKTHTLVVQGCRCDSGAPKTDVSAPNVDTDAGSPDRQGPRETDKGDRQLPAFKCFK